MFITNKNFEAYKNFEAHALTFITDCDFENMPCTWNEVQEETLIMGKPVTDTNDWSLKEGSTDSEGTGPSGRHLQCSS